MSTAWLFDALGERYDRWYERHKLLAVLEATLVSRMVSKGSRPLVEVGVGTGFFASRVGAEAGIDPSMSMLGIARERMPSSLLVAGRGERLPLRSSSFGTVLIVVTLCFVDDPGEVLRESWRILKPRGSLVSCIVPGDSSWGRWYRKLGKEGHPFYSHARFLDRGEHLSLIEDAGFRVVEELGVLSFPPWGEPRLEEPRPWNGDLGFICVRALKSLKGPKR